MAVLYTPKQIEAALKTLRIQPTDGLVSGQEAARILTWRASHEQGVTHEYRLSALRKHVAKGHLAGRLASTRKYQYKVEDIFQLPLTPRRGARSDIPPRPRKRQKRSSLPEVAR